jgi:hypothetical protein
VEGERAPTTQAMGTAGRWGKIERRSRATHSAPQLGRGRTVEGDQRQRGVCNSGGLEWRRWELREERGCLGGAGRGGERCQAIYNRGKGGISAGLEHAELVLACQWGSAGRSKGAAGDGT